MRNDLRTGVGWRMISVRRDTHDRHPTTTLLTLTGIPLVLVVAVAGLPPFDIHGPLHYLGVMGPSCGITRGVMWAARGDLAQAWRFNPASLLVIPTMIVLTGRVVYGRLTNRWLNMTIRWRPWLWVIPAVLALILSIRQQLIIDFLLANPAG